jgi:hypothetical protein
MVSSHATSVTLEVEQGWIIMGAEACPEVTSGVLPVERRLREVRLSLSLGNRKMESRIPTC